jgi:hypothetical protein
MGRGKGGGTDFRGLLRWPAWALALLAFASAFTPLSPALMHGLKWAMFVGGVLFAGMSMGEGRRVPFFLYAFMALLFNPIVPFRLAPEILRLTLAASAIWLVADHLPGRE